jgi:hypothetical protein
VPLEGHSAVTPCSFSLGPSYWPAGDATTHCQLLCPEPKAPSSAQPCSCFFGLALLTCPGHASYFSLSPGVGSPAQASCFPTKTLSSPHRSQAGQKVTLVSAQVPMRAVSFTDAYWCQAPCFPQTDSWIIPSVLERGRHCYPIYNAKARAKGS